MSERLSRISGVDIASDWIVTSSEAAVRMLHEHERPAMVLGGAGIASALEAARVPITADAKDARALLVGP